MFARNMQWRNSRGEREWGIIFIAITATTCMEFKELTQKVL